MKNLSFLIFLSLFQLVHADDFSYSKFRARKETKYILEKIKDLYSSEGGMAREYVLPEQYKNVVDKYEDIIDLIKHGKAPVLKPKEIIGFSQPSLVINNKLTLVVHAYGNYDYFWSSAAEINRVLQNSQSERQSIGFIVSDPENPDFLMMGKRPVDRTGHVSWITQFKTPDFAYVSPVGSHNIIVKADEVTVVGGYWNGCLTRAVKNLIWNREELVKRDPLVNRVFKVNLNLKGIYRHYYNVSRLIDINNPQSVISFWNATPATITKMPQGLEEYRYKVQMNEAVLIDNEGESLQQVIFNIIP
jgi:hypothetical protein